MTVYRVIGIAILIFGVWEILASIEFLQQLKSRLKKLIFLIESLFVITIGIMFIMKDLLWVKIFNSRSVFTTILPIVLISVGMLYLWVSQDRTYLNMCSDFEHKVFLRLLPKVKERAYRYDFIFGGIALIVCGGVAIYLFWIRKIP